MAKRERNHQEPKGDVSEIERMRGELRDGQEAANAAAKTAKEKLPATTATKTVKPLVDVIAKQLLEPPKWAVLYVASFVAAREKSGQDRAEAVEEVLEELRPLVLGLLAIEPSSAARRIEAWDNMGAAVRTFADASFVETPATTPTEPTETVEGESEVGEAEGDAELELTTGGTAPESE